MRQRPAPTARRTAISRLRPAARTSSRLARLPQAIRSTSVAIAMRTAPPLAMAGRLRAPMAASDTLSSLIRRPWLSLGYSRSRSAAITFIAASACRIPMSGFSRPTTENSKARRWSTQATLGYTCSYMAMGIQRSAAISVSKP